MPTRLTRWINSSRRPIPSTNGSVLHTPGVEPRTLIGGQSAVVTPGTVIELGDGNLIELLGPDPDAASSDPTGVRR